LLLVLVFISLVGLLVQQQVTETLESNVEQQLREEVETEANQPSGWVEANERPVLAISDHPALNNSAQRQAYVEDARQTQFRGGRVAAIHIVHAVGNVEIIASTDQERIGETVDQEPWTGLLGGVGVDDVSTTEPYSNANGETVVIVRLPAPDSGIFPSDVDTGTANGLVADGSPPDDDTTADEE
jgi:hypothetical protein